MNCSNCGAENTANDKFCSACGAELIAEKGRFCTNCGTEIFDTDTFCPGCGIKTMQSSNSLNNQNQANQQMRMPQQPPKRGTSAGVVVLIVIVALLVALAAAYIGYKFWSESKTDWTENGYIDTPVQTQSQEVGQNPEPTLMPSAPEFDWVVASSTRDYDTDNATGEIIHYYPEYAIDGDMRTAWSSDRKIESMPTITLNANDDQYVTGIRMTNGYCKSEKTYTKNRRITRVRVSYRGGVEEAYFSIDGYRQMMDIKFDRPVYTDYVSVTVLETYAGEWKDIAISEIEAY